MSKSSRYCIDCKKEISSNAKTCPFCGSSAPLGTSFGCIGILSFAGGIALIQSGSWGWGFVAIGVTCIFVVAAYGNYLTSTTAPPDSENHTNQDKRSAKQPYTQPNISQYWETTESVPVNTSLRLNYTDANGDNSEREVRIDKYNGSCYLNGYCNLRKDIRSFRIDRIKECIDIDSGEVVNDIPAHLKRKYKSSPGYKLQATFKNHQDIIKVLYYVGKADSQLRAAELKIIGIVVRKLAQEPSITDTQIKKELQKLQMPTLQVFKRAVGRIAKSNTDNLTAVNKAATAIVNTQKTISPGEKEALLYINKVISATTPK